MADTSKNAITTDYVAKANSILFDKGKTFYWAKRFLNAHTAQRAIRLYRFCRLIDDIADESVDQNQALTHLNRIKTSLQQGTSDDIVVSDAIALFKECNIPIAVPTALIEGVLTDLTLVQIKDAPQLIEYCYRVAGTVGIMMCKALNVSDTNAIYHAVDLGIGMQLTNICRDVHADAIIGRVYLPESMTGPLTPNDVTEPSDGTKKKLTSAIQLLLNRADAYYASGYSGLTYLPLRSRLSMLVAAKLYQQIGLKINKSKRYAIKTKVFVPPHTKFLISIRVILCAMLDREFWRYQSTHDKSLHQLIKKHPFCHG